MYLTRRTLFVRRAVKGNKSACTVRNASKQAVSASKDLLTVNLPNVSQYPVVSPVQIPYMPDFWNSARSKPDAPPEPELPKVHVVGGSATHYDGGPTYNLEKLQEDSSSSPTVPARDLPPSNDLGFWADFWESLGLPRSFSVCRSLSEATAQAANDEPQLQSRPLTDDERKGLYVFLGIVGASWLVGALVNRPTVVTEEHGTQTSR